jgi:hypothetical protein
MEVLEEDPLAALAATKEMHLDSWSSPCTPLSFADSTETRAQSRAPL